MNLIPNKPISAFCILCHDADAVVPFYVELLGFKLQRAEESFYSFQRRGTATTLCLWEIGHIAHHTTYNTYSETEVPNKVVLSLTLSSRDEIDQLHLDLKTTTATLLSDPSSDENYGFEFIDPCGMIWEVTTSDKLESGVSDAMGRITLICQDFEGTKAFYEDRLLCVVDSAESSSRITYPPINNTSLSLWDAKAATKTLGIDFTIQQPAWTANTAMLAHPFDSMPQLQTAFASLKKKGVLFDHAPAFFDWDFNAAYFRDPENNIWELFEMPSNIVQRQLPAED